MVLGNVAFVVGLLLEESDELLVTETLLFAFLLFGELQLLVADLPEVGEVFLLLEFVALVLALAVNLQRTRAFNSLLHFKFAALLLLIESVGLVLGFGDLLVQNLLLVVTEGSKLLNLGVNHLLSDFEFVFGTVLNGIYAHLVHLKFFLSELFDACLFLEFFLSGELGHSNLVGVGLHNVSLNTSSLLLALELSDLLALQVLLSLAFDKFALEHVLFQRLDVVDLEFLELVTDGLSIFHLFVVLTFELGTHLGVVLLHLLLLEFLPVFCDILLDGVFASSVLTLGVLLLHHIRNQHLRLEGLNHVLSVVQLSVSFFNLLTAQLILELLLLSVDFASRNLLIFEAPNTVVLTLNASCF